MMDVDSSITPRLRMSRHSPVQYGRSSNLLASTSEAGPSRLFNFSQILDLDMKDMPLSDDRFSSNEQNTPKTTTIPTATRSDNPAAVLRALLSRLPAHPPSPTKSHVLSEQERESDFDTVSESDIASSIAQESLKYVFSNALRDPGNTPQKVRRKRNSREVMEQSSSSNDSIQRNGDTPLGADDGLSYLKTPARAEATHGFQSSANLKTPKPPGGWVSTPATIPITAQSMPVDSPLAILERNQGLLTPIASFSKGSNLEPKTPAAPGAWLPTPAVKKSILKVRFEPEVSTFTDNSESGKHLEPSFDSSISGVDGLDDSDDGLQRAEELSSKSPPSPPRQKLLKSPKIRVLDAFGREHVEDTETAATPSHSTVSRGELLSRIRNGLDDLVVGLDDLVVGLDDLVVGIDDLDKDDQPLSINHNRVQELSRISSRSRGLRERLISQVDNSRFSLSSTKASWFPANPKVYIFLIILQLSLTWLVYRIFINLAQELWLNRYYDPFNPELDIYIYKSDASMHVLRSEGARTTAWSSLVGHIWDGWIYFIGNMQLRFRQAWDKGPVLQYDNTWTPT